MDIIDDVEAIPSKAESFDTAFKHSLQQNEFEKIMRTFQIVSFFFTTLARDFADDRFLDYYFLAQRITYLTDQVRSYLANSFFTHTPVKISKQTLQFYSYQSNKDVKPDSLFVTIQDPTDLPSHFYFYTSLGNQKITDPADVFFTPKRRTTSYLLQLEQSNCFPLEIGYCCYDCHSHLISIPIVFINIRKVLADQTNFHHTFQFKFNNTPLEIHVNLSTHLPLVRLTEQPRTFEYYIIDSINADIANICAHSHSYFAAVSQAYMQSLGKERTATFALLDMQYLQQIEQNRETHTLKEELSRVRVLAQSEEEKKNTAMKEREELRREKEKAISSARESERIAEQLKRTIIDLQKRISELEAQLRDLQKGNETTRKEANHTFPPFNFQSVQPHIIREQPSHTELPFTALNRSDHMANRQLTTSLGGINVSQSYSVREQSTMRINPPATISQSSVSSYPEIPPGLSQSTISRRPYLFTTQFRSNK